MELLLTPWAAATLRSIRYWSHERFGKKNAEKYFVDIDKALSFIAQSCGKVVSRDDLTGDSGFSIYPVREHFIVFDVLNGTIFVFDFVKQERDILTVLNDYAARFRRHAAQLGKKYNVKRSRRASRKKP